MAESTPVSSVMRASTWTCAPFRLARTSEICGGLVSSARAAAAKHRTIATVAIRMRQDYRTCPPLASLHQTPSGGGGLRGELDRNGLRDARLLHGHAVERV